jgi:hypothetical protein
MAYGLDIPASTTAKRKGEKISQPGVVSLIGRQQETVMGV